jgi:penicillin-binding protein 2
VSYYQPEDRRPPTTPQLALRVAALGFVALALFAIIFFRLWYLQVLAGDQYLAQANQNRVRNIPIAAPRGDIVDRAGRPIVTSRLANVVQISPRSLPQSERDVAATWGRDAGILAKRWLAGHSDSYRRRHRAARAPLPPYPPMTPALAARFTAIGRVVGMRATTIQKAVVRSLATLPYGAVTLRVDVPRTMLDYLQERKPRYPGVLPDQIFLRQYPQSTLAAQLLGNVGEVSENQLKESAFKGVRPGTIVGKDGIELSYDRYLRGRDGARRLQVDAAGNFIGELVRTRRNPIAGHTVKLSLDLGLQQVGQRGLQLGIDAANANGHPARAGGFVAMNPVSGEIYALGSLPSYDPKIFTKPISDRRYRELNSEAGGAPLFNRAILGAYPTGSTFKPFTALGAMAAGKITPSYSVNDTGCITIAPGTPPICNAGKVPNGVVDLRSALRVSSDVYFYQVGLLTNSAHTEVIQSMARRLGLGRPTGIDLPTDSYGNVPDWRWRLQRGKVEAACRHKLHIPLSATVFEAAAKGCGISDMRPWSEGDNVNLAVGQGDVQASPLQMAVAYSAIANGRWVPRPHVGLEIDDSSDRLVQKIAPGVARPIHLDPVARAAVLDGLHGAASAPGGTSTPVWSGGQTPWPQDRLPVYGKTGTAQTYDHGIEYDQSWYVCWIRDLAHPRDPGLVIAATVEKGGFGAEAAAPVARYIASKYFGIRPEFVVGSSRTR